MSIERQKTFNIGQKKFTAKFPNVGQLIDLESMKQAVTNNRYGQMAISGIVSMYEALDLVDAITFYQVVVPEVGKYYDIQNFGSLELDKAKELVEVYQFVIKPWFDKTMQELKGIRIDETTETENKD
jgi:hypothetical protein